MSGPYEDDLFISRFQVMHIATIHHNAVPIESRKPRLSRSLPAHFPFDNERERQIKGHLAIP